MAIVNGNTLILVDHRFEALCQEIYGADISLAKNIYNDGSWTYQCLAVINAWEMWCKSRECAFIDADRYIKHVKDASKNSMFRAGAACSANELKRLH